MGELKRVEVEGAVYELRRWDYEDGKLWCFRLLALLAKGAGGTASLAASDADAVADIIESLGEDQFLAFCSMVEGYTNLVQVKDGRETILPLAKVKTVHMQGRYLDLAMLLKEHVEQEFAPFFFGMKELLAGVSAGTGKTDT